MKKKALLPVTCHGNGGCRRGSTEEMSAKPIKPKMI